MGAAGQPDDSPSHGGLTVTPAAGNIYTGRVTFLCASILVDSVLDCSAAIERARLAAVQGASLVEWRIDPFADEPEAIAATLRLVRESPLPCIVTCRNEEEGGFYAGDDSWRISLLEALGTMEHPPRYLDVELATYQRSRNLRQKVNLAVGHDQQVREVSTGLMLSSHDFEGRPRDLLQRIEAMTNEDVCRVIKVAWRARSLRDNLEALDLLTERRKPTIALCMGEFGLMSRVLAPKFGGLLTFGSVDAGEETAPGQPTIRDLHDLYRFGSIGPRTAVYGVIGWPVAHSLSPKLHNAGFAHAGIDAVYLPLAIPPEWEHFKATVGALIDHPRLDFRGASITMPHKEHLVRFVRERGGIVKTGVEEIGAANTLLIETNRSLSCDNTDAMAAVALIEGLEHRKWALTHDREIRVAVIGAGGVARAVAGGLARAGYVVVVFGRTPDNVDRLVGDLQAVRTFRGEPARIVAGRMESLGCGCFHVFVNCTPIGMKGGDAPDESPLPDEVALDDSNLVMDTVYVPRETPLVRESRSRGAAVIDGLQFFIRQAELQFRSWTNTALPTAAIRAIQPQRSSAESGSE